MHVNNYRVAHKIGSTPTHQETNHPVSSVTDSLRWFHRGEGVRPARVQAGIPDDTLHCPSGCHALLLHQEPDVRHLELKFEIGFVRTQHLLEAKIMLSVTNLWFWIDEMMANVA